MWRWLPTKFSKRTQLVAKLALIVILFHALVIAFCSRYTSRNPMNVRVTAHMLDADIAVVVMPFVKRTGALERYGSRRSDSATHRPARQQQRVLARHSRSHASAHKPRAKVNPARTQAAKKQRPVLVTKARPVRAHKPLRGKNNKKKSNARIQPQNSAQVTEQKPAEVNVEQENVSEKSLLLPLAMHKQQAIGQLSYEQSVDDTLTESGEHVMEINVPGTGTEPLDGPLVLGLQEYEELQRYQEVHERMCKQWHPPVGLQVKKPCIVLVTVNAQGHGEQMVVEQSSGVLAYDMAARMAVYRTEFPPCVWNQQIRLHF